jgi:erythromycin esterase
MGKDKLIIFSHKDSMDKIVLKSKYNDNNSDKENYVNNGQRAIGVVYNPNYERYGNYVPTILNLRYDVLLFIDKTNALSPLHMQSIKDKDFPETFPTGI